MSQADTKTGITKGWAPLTNKKTNISYSIAEDKLVETAS